MTTPLMCFCIALEMDGKCRTMCLYRCGGSLKGQYNFYFYCGKCEVISMVIQKVLKF